MVTHASVPVRGTRSRPGSRARRPTTLSWALPVTLGVILGWWATSIVRGGGVLTGTQLALGLVSGAVFAVLCYGLGRMQKSLPSHIAAGGYAVLAGGGIGFLYSLSEKSTVLASCVLGLVVGAGMFVTAFYSLYMQEN